MNGAFHNPLARRAPGLVDHARTIKKWVRETLDLSGDTVVSVNELACHLPGCPPKETVVLVMLPGAETMQVSIHKAIVDVSRAEILDAFSALKR